MAQNGRKNAAILVIDDEEANVTLVRRILERDGYTNVSCGTDPREIPSIYRKTPPDLLITDLIMPGLDGFELIERVREESADSGYRPIMVVSGDGERDTKERALSSGVNDFMTKPVSPAELRLRVANLLETRFLHLALQEHSERLEDKVRERTAELNEARLEILDRLALAAEYRDDQTGEHTRRVGDQSARLAEALGMNPADVERIRRAAPLHDIGKIGVSDQILLKKGKLTPSEMEDMRRHSVIGARVLSGSRFPLLRMAEEIALCHHENWDGSGYPMGLRGNAIPLAARIVAVVDVFDSLTHERPYKRAWSASEALDEIDREMGRKFDPEVARTFLVLHGRPGTEAPEEE